MRPRGSSRSASRGASASAGGRALQSTQTGQPPYPAVVHAFPADVRCLAVVGEEVWCGERSGVVKVRDAGSGHEALFQPDSDPKATRTADVFRRPGFLPTCMAKVGQDVWIGFNDGVVRVYHAKTKTLRAEFGRHTGGVTAVHASLPFAFTAGADGRIVQYCASSHQQVAKLHAPNSCSTPIRCVTAGDTTLPLVFTGAEDGVVRCWRRAEYGGPAEYRGAFPARGQGHTAALTALLLLRNHLWTASEDRSVKVWDIAAQACLRSVEVFGAGVSGIVHHAGEVLAKCRNGSLTVINATAYTVAGPKYPEGVGRSAVFADAGVWKGARLWAVEDGTVRILRRPARDGGADDAEALIRARDAEIAALLARNTALEGDLRATHRALDDREHDAFCTMEAAIETASPGRAPDLLRSLQAAQGRAEELKRENDVLKAEVDAARGRNPVGGRSPSPRGRGTPRGKGSAKAAVDAEETEELLRKTEMMAEALVTTQRELQNVSEAATRKEAEARRQLASLAKDNEKLRDRLVERDLEVTELKQSLDTAMRDVAALAKYRNMVEGGSSVGGMHTEERYTALQAELTQARNDRTLLTSEVARLGEILSEVSAKAKEYQAQNAQLLQQVKSDLAEEKVGVQRALADTQCKLDASANELQSALSTVNERERTIKELKSFIFETGTAGSGDAFPQQSEAQSRLSAAEAKVDEQKGEIKVLQERLLKECGADSNRLALYTQLQHERAVKDNMKSNNEALSDMVLQLRERVLVLSTANTKLQEELDRGPGHGGAPSEAASAPRQHGDDEAPQSQPHNVESAKLREMIKDFERAGLHPQTVAPELMKAATAVEGAFLADMGLPVAGAGAGAGRGHADEMEEELDGLVQYLDRMRRKLETLEHAAETAGDPYLRDALLQEISALHRQVLDDSLRHKHRGGALGAIPALGSGAGGTPHLTSPEANGILCLASERLTQVEHSLNLSPTKSPPAIPGHPHPNASATHSPAARTASPYEVRPDAPLDVLGGAPQRPPEYNMREVPNMIRRAYGTMPAWQ